MKNFGYLVILLAWILPTSAAAQENDQRCSNNKARAWWDVQAYNLKLDLTDTVSFSIHGTNTITAKVIRQPGDSLQIDLKEPLQITEIRFRDSVCTAVPFQGGVWVTGVFSDLQEGEIFTLEVDYNGIPQEAAGAPWQSGMIHTKDEEGAPWWGVACQSEGAYVWMPCKNFSGDEPEQVTTSFTVPEQYTAIGNGRLFLSRPAGIHAKTWIWHTANPINNYDITFYMGNYAHWADTFNGVKGTLPLDYYVLPKDLDQAKEQFRQVKTMLRCFESKFGPYPFYKDGYKLVAAPYLGMEHQSAIAYGNGYVNGYAGTDRSRTDVGLLFDFIIIHESAHEWFGNSITAYDVADSWIQEGFTSYAEAIYAECIADREAGFTYQRGKRHLIKNDRPVEGQFNACDPGSTDHYDKAAFMIHMIRVMMQDDSRFYAMLKAMNRAYFHQIVSGDELERFISKYSGRDLSKFFDQYLREAELPILELKTNGSHFVAYRWTNCVSGFNMPVIWNDKDKPQWIHPTTNWQTLPTRAFTRPTQISPDFLINYRITK